MASAVPLKAEGAWSRECAEALAALSRADGELLALRRLQARLDLIGADPRTGAIAINALPRLGRTIQFQRRDAAAATEDMVALLSRAKHKLGSAPVFGGCLCSCNGRGRRLFGRASHDAQLVQQQLGPLGLAGFFCNGEIGPVGGHNYVHGYTASIALLADA